MTCALVTEAGLAGVVEGSPAGGGSLPTNNSIDDGAGEGGEEPPWSPVRCDSSAGSVGSASSNTARLVNTGFASPLERAGRRLYAHAVDQQRRHKEAAQALHQVTKGALRMLGLFALHARVCWAWVGVPLYRLHFFMPAMNVSRCCVGPGDTVRLCYGPSSVLSLPPPGALPCPTRTSEPHIHTPPAVQKEYLEAYGSGPQARPLPGLYHVQGQFASVAERWVAGACVARRGCCPRDSVG